MDPNSIVYNSAHLVKRIYFMFRSYHEKTGSELKLYFNYATGSFNFQDKYNRNLPYTTNYEDRYNLKELKSELEFFTSYDNKY